MKVHPRRRLLAAFVLCAAAGAQTPPQMPEIKVRRLSPRAAVFNLGSSAGAVAVLALATQKGIVVVDAPHNRDVGKAFRDAIQIEFKRSDFAYLIDSHGHTDHTGGNSAYSDLPIVGHEIDRDWMLNEIAYMRAYFLKNAPEVLATPAFAPYEKLSPKKIEVPWFTRDEESMKGAIARYRSGQVPVPPTITFNRQMALSLGDMTVRLTYYGHAHSASDTIIGVPEENLAMTGSLFIPGQIPQLGVRGNPVGAGKAAPGSAPPPQVVDNWLIVLQELLNDANENTRFIPSHGAVSMNKAQIQQFRSYIEKLWSEVRRAKAAGKTLDQTKTALALRSQFPEAAGLADEANLGTKYETLGLHQYNIEYLWKVLEK